MSHNSISNRTAAFFAALAGCAWIAGGAMQLTAADQVRIAENYTFITHLSLGLMAVALLAAIPAVLKLADFATSRTGAYLAVTGQGLLAIASTVSNIVGYDPTFFLVAAPIANLLWLVGSIWLAVSLSKAGQMPRWVAIGLPLVQIACLPLSAIGGGILAGAWWIAAGLFIKDEGTEPSEARPATA